MTLRGLARASILGVAALAWSGAATAAITPCNATLNIADQDPAGLNVRASPGGPVITALKLRGRWIEVEVTGQDGAWARIKSATVQADANGDVDPRTSGVIWKGAGWVAFSKLGIEDFDSRSRFYAAPAETAKLVLSLEGYDDQKIPKTEAILGCDGDWLKVKIKGVVGWTHEWCTDQLSTCD